MATTVANPSELANPDQTAQTIKAERVQEPIAQPLAASANQSEGGPIIKGSFPSPTEILSQPAVRRSMPAIVTLLTAAVFIIAYLWLQAPPYRTVHSGLSEADRQAAYEALASGDFQAKIDSSTGELTVPDSKYHEARIFLASRGLPQGGATNGMDSLSNDASMTTSQFMEQVRYTSAMEQELARSITQIVTVMSARVHLASPKQSVFVRNRTPAKASVVVTPKPGRVVSSSQVEAIVHLVASSIPYLAAEDVVVVDQRGKLLTDANSFDSMQLSSVQMEHKQRLEETYRNRIDAMLSPVLGEGNVRSEVDLKIDFTQIESTFEEYDGNNNGPRARSEILMTERGNSRPAAGIPGATSNTPPTEDEIIVGGQLSATEGVESLGTISNKTTRNYEIDRAVRHVKHQGGKVERVSVAVVINELAAPSSARDTENGQTEGNVGFSDIQLERFNDLVKGVVGFDAERGDVVTIVSAVFDEPLVIDTSLPWYESNQVVSTIKGLGAMIAFIVLLLVVVRPVIKSYLPEIDEVLEQGTTKLKDGELTQEELDMIELGDDESLEDIKAKLKPKKSTISADMLDTANTYDDKVALVRLLVAEDSGRVANVLKKMIKPI